MARRRVIAYPMHEYEMSEVADAISEDEDDTVATEAFRSGYLDDGEIERLRAEGIFVEVIDEDAAGTTASLARRSLTLGAGVLSSDEPEPPAPGEFVNWRLHLKGPMVEEVRAEIRQAAGEVMEALGRFSFLVVGTTDVADALAAHPIVRAIERYAGEDVGAIGFRTAGMAVGTSAGDADQAAEWDVVYSSPRWAADSFDWLTDRAGEVRTVSPRIHRITATPGDEVLRQVTHRPGVVSVVEHVEPELQLDRTSALIGARGPFPVPGGLDGSGQIVAVADTGVDTEHPDLAGRLVPPPSALGRPGDTSDPDGHGTHVAGTIVGSGSAGGGAHTGVAPGATVFFQSLYRSPASRLGGLPADLSELLGDALAAGAFIHNDSWGALVDSAYDSKSVQIDEFVSDHPELLVVVAAGNEGDASHTRIRPPGYTDHYSVTSPATAKNALTVGASRSDRATDLAHRDLWPDRFPDPPIAEALVAGDAECLAGFSSRGPCDDERIKPDVVAPGTHIVAARSSIAPDERFDPIDAPAGYGAMSGTSMAAPLVAGAAALVRQYYVEHRTHEPSAALIKATLINGARQLTGLDADTDERGLPNPDQGFGCIDLLASLPDEHRSLDFIDTWRGDDDRYVMDRTGMRFRFEVTVDEPGHTLCGTLAWTDRPGRAAQQDLGLFVELHDGSKRVGNESRAHQAYETDVTNTVERFVLPEAAPGRYLFNVISRSLAFTDPAQDFALVVTGAFAGELQLRGNY